MASSIGGTPKASAISRADSVTGIKKAPDKSGASSAQYCCRSAAGEEIDDYEKYDHRERADHEHVAHIMPGDGSPRFGRAFNDAVVFHPRHMLAPWTATCRRSGNNAEARGDVPPGAGRLRAQMWSVLNHYPSSVTLSRSIFLSQQRAAC